ncbi:MAG: hypothetical protein J3R72DRAFT_479211, partial [Linnemannia gamsii]
MDTLLYFLSDLPNGLSSLLHQDFASALFSPPSSPPSSSSSTRYTPQHQHHGSWFSNYYHYYHGGNNVHGPQRIQPHPLLEMAASNMLVRLGLLAVLCLGAFYYCVTTMEQQQRQIAGADGDAGSNWLADPVPSSTTAANASNDNLTTATTSATGGSNGALTAATESHPRRSMSNLYPSATTTMTNDSNMSLGGSTAGITTGARTASLLTPNMTAAEVMALLGRRVNNLEQLHRQQSHQLQQQQQQQQGPARGSLLSLTLVNGRRQPGPDFADSTTTTPSTTPSSITATIILALIRSTATAMALTCGTTEAHLLSSSASTTPTIPCSDVFSRSENNNNKAYVAGDKPGIETEWNQDVKDDIRALKVKKDTSQDQDNDLTPPAYKKDKQKELDSCNDNDDDESVYQSEQEFGHFSTATPFFDPTSEEDSWREYRNMMYYSTNYPPPYNTGGGESSRSNSRRSSIFAPSPSSPAPTTTAHVATRGELDREVERSELAEEKEVVGAKEEEDLPLWAHFYSLDALQSIICQRLFSASLAQQQQHRQSYGQCTRSLFHPKQTRTSKRKVQRLSRMILSRRISAFGSSSNSSSPSTNSPSPSASVSTPSSASMSIWSTSMQSLVQLGRATT